MDAASIPRPFFWRRVHSLTGLMLVMFLFEHLFTNSQAALLFGADGNGFVRAVDFIHNLPYLGVIEITLIGIPLLFHAVLGVKYALRGRSNIAKGDGTRPSLKLERNRAYSLQRISSYILLVGIILHVAYMRFYIYPVEVKEGSVRYYFVRLSVDNGLYTVANRLGVKLFDESAIRNYERDLEEARSKIHFVHKQMMQLERKEGFDREHVPYDNETKHVLDTWQGFQQKVAFYREGLLHRKINSSQVIAVSSRFGDVILLNVRDAFKSPTKVGLYTIFVLAAAFHGFNGLWAFMISWGVIIKASSQRKVLGGCSLLMMLVAFMGLIAIWGTYFINLRH